jgi:hypothetical protein
VNIRTALKEQYHAGLAMLDDCLQKCPDDLWLQGEPPRSFWRIAWHTLYFTHNYMVQTADDFNASVAAWPEPIRQKLGVGETRAAIDVEPYELPESVGPLSKAELREYLAYIDSLVDATVDSLDLDTEESGFPWYGGISKLSHQLLNIRHLGGHVGQLSELLMMRGIDTDWVSKSGGLARGSDPTS